MKLLNMESMESTDIGKTASVVQFEPGSLQDLQVGAKAEMIKLMARGVLDVSVKQIKSLT